MSGKTNRQVNQGGRESYGDEALEGATSILQGNDEFVVEDYKFKASFAEESTARSRSQRAGNLARHTSGTANERKE